MEIAVDVMTKSIDEQNKKNPSPRVGAVLVFPNGDYDVAWRGQFREGDNRESPKSNKYKYVFKAD